MFLLFEMKRIFCIVIVACLMHGISAATDDKSKVKVELYYEAQCPACSRTITQSFKEAFTIKGFLKMADVSFIPFGNAKETGKSAPYEFECQHGESECQYNLVESCALNKLSCDFQKFQFIDCVENFNYNRDPHQDYDRVVEGCAIIANISGHATKEIKDCYKGLEGNKLEHEMAIKTGLLSPAHEYVPWIVVNGKHTDEIQDAVYDSLFGYVCDNYKGPDKSEECPPEGDSSTGVEFYGYNEVCLRDEITTQSA